MKPISVFSVLTTLLFFATGSASAAGNNCRDVLLQDVVETSLDQSVGAIWVSNVTKSQADARSKGGKAEFTIKKIPVSLGYDSARATASLVESYQQLDYTSDTQLRKLERSLSKNALEAYRSCQGTINVDITVSDNLESAPNGAGIVTWKAGAGAPAGATISLTATNGQFFKDGLLTDKIEETIFPFGEIPFQLRGRNTFEGTTISARVVKDSYSVVGHREIAPYRPYEILARAKESDDEVDIKSNRAQATQSGGTCVTPDHERKVLLVETATWVSSRGTTPGAVTAAIDATSNPHRVCGSIHATGTKWWPAASKARLSVIQVWVEAPGGTAPASVAPTATR